MKKYVAFFICIALLVGAFLLPRGENAIAAGKGKKDNAEIRNVRDAGLALAAISSTKDLGYQSETSMDNLPLFSKYKSATLSFESTYYYSFEPSLRRENEYDHKMKMDRSMTCYYTETESYYNISSTIRSSTASSFSSGTSKSGTSIDFEIYINARKEMQLVKINHFTQAVEASYDKEGIELPEGMLNRWMTMGMLDSTLDSATWKYIYRITHEQIFTIEDYLLTLDKGQFSKSGDVYTLKEMSAIELCTDVNDITEQSFDPELFKETQFSVDLSSNERPLVNMLYTAEKASDGVSFKAGQALTFYLSNINNTVIKFPSDIEIYGAYNYNNKEENNG